MDVDEDYDEVFEFWIPGVCLSGKIYVPYIEETLSSLYSWKYYVILQYNISGISLLGFIGNILSAVILSR